MTVDVCMFFPKSHDISLPGTRTNQPNVGCFSHQVAHPPAPAWSPNQCPSNNVPDEADISGWWQWFNRKMVVVDPLRLGPETYHIWENPTWRKVHVITYIYVMMIRIWKTSNQSLVFTNLYIYIYNIYFQGSSKVVNIQFFTLFKPYHNCLEILKPKPLTDGSRRSHLALLPATWGWKGPTLGHGSKNPAPQLLGLSVRFEDPSITW